MTTTDDKTFLLIQARNRLHDIHEGFSRGFSLDLHKDVDVINVLLREIFELTSGINGKIETWSEDILSGFRNDYDIASQCVDILVNALDDKSIIEAWPELRDESWNNLTRFRTDEYDTHVMDLQGGSVVDKSENFITSLIAVAQYQIAVVALTEVNKMIQKSPKINEARIVNGSFERQMIHVFTLIDYSYDLAQNFAHWIELVYGAWISVYRYGYSLYGPTEVWPTEVIDKFYSIYSKLLETTHTLAKNENNEVMHIISHDLLVEFGDVLKKYAEHKEDNLIFRKAPDDFSSFTLPGGSAESDNYIDDCMANFPFLTKVMNSIATAVTERENDGQSD